MEFTFSPVVEKLDGVPEQFRPLYAEKEGKFALKIEDATVKGAVEAILGLNKALHSERKTKVDLTPLKEYGGSVEEIAAGVRTKLEELAGAAGGAEKMKAQIEKIKADLASGHAKESAAKDARVAALTNQLHTYLIESAAKSAVAAEKGDIELLMPFVRSRVRATEENGVIAVKVVDDAGDPRYSGVTGQPMSIAELVKEMKANTKYGKLFESEAPKGGGPRPGASASKTIPAGEGRELTSVEKIQRGFAARGR